MNEEAAHRVAMTEQVARAICQADEQNGGAPWDWYRDDKARSGYFDSARAAIAALATHRVSPDEDAVKRVAKAIDDRLLRSNFALGKEIIEQCAKGAIAAIAAPTKDERK